MIENNEIGGKKVDDIFSDTESESMADDASVVLAESENKNISQDPIINYDQSISSSSSNNIAKVFSIFGILIILAALLLGGYWVYNKYGKSIIAGKTKLQENKIENIQSIQTQEKPVENNQTQTAQPAQSEQTKVNDNQVKIIDSDQDGLSDDAEKQLGTNPNEIDTDQDGLFDPEETRVYKTDPLKSDTDGDGHSDGSEVKGGYNPNGPGKLYEIKK